MPSPVEARHISVYRRGRTIVVLSSAQAELWFTTPPCYVVPDVAADEELGAAVVQAIQSVSLSAPPPTDDERDAWEREILESVGVKDWATLERNAKLAHIYLDGRGWQLNRMRRWRRGGWISHPARRRSRGSPPAGRDGG